MVETQLTLDKAVPNQNIYGINEKNVATFSLGSNSGKFNKELHRMANQSSNKPQHSICIRKGRSNSWKCTCFGKIGHYFNICQLKNVECFVCGKHGHLESMCRNAANVSKDQILIN